MTPSKPIKPSTGIRSKKVKQASLIAHQSALPKTRFLASMAVIQSVFYARREASSMGLTISLSKSITRLRKVRHCSKCASIKPSSKARHTKKKTRLPLNTKTYPQTKCRRNSRKQLGLRCFQRVGLEYSSSSCQLGSAADFKAIAPVHIRLRRSARSDHPSHTEATYEGITPTRATTFNRFTAKSLARTSMARRERRHLHRIKSC